MHQCPRCKSKDIHRSRSKSWWEGWRRKLTGKRPYRCKACVWRGWGVDLGPRFDDHDVELATRALAPEPPNLDAVDAVAAREEKPDEIGLKQLR